MGSRPGSLRARGKPAHTTIAARRATTAKLRESEARLRLALDAAQVGIYDWDIPRDRITWSQWHEQLWGFKPGEFRGTYQEFAERVHPQDLPRVSEELARCRAARERYSCEFRVVWPDGTERWILDRGEFSFGRAGVAVAMRGIVKDITERRHIERQLRESEEKFSKAFHASPAMVVITTLDGKNVEVNDAYAAFIGRPRDQIIGKTVTDLRILDAAERQKLIDLIDRGGGTVCNAEVAVRTSAGAQLQFLMSSDTIALSGVPHRLSTMLDITERKQREDALREIGERLNFVISGTETGLWDWDLTTNEVRYSREWKQLLGYQDHEIADHLDEWRRLVHPEDVELTLSKLTAFLQQQVGTLEAEFRMRYANGEYRWILSRTTVQPGKDGKPARLLGLHIGIDDRKRLEQSLIASHQQLQSFVEQAPVAIAMFDRDMRYLVYSRQWANDYGAGFDDLTGRSHYEVFPNLPERWKTVHRQGLAGQTVRHDDDLWIKEDGTRQWLRWVVLPWRDTRGDIGGIMIFAEDVTARKRTEEELRNLSRRLMESQDTSRRDIARELHDRIGQNLAALSLNLSIIKAQDPAQRPAAIPARLDDSVSLVAATMDRVRNLMADLRPPALDDYGLAAALRWYGKLFSERSGVAVRVVSGESPLRLPPGVETAVFRIAEEALTNVGRHAAAHDVVITLAETAGEVRLTIADDGQGFDAASLRKSVSWGMTSMRERAEAIGAHCDIESVLGRGTTVTVRIPRP